MSKTLERGIRNVSEKRSATEEELLRYVEEDRQYLRDAKANLPRIKRKMLFQCFATLSFVLILLGIRWHWFLQQSGWSAVYRALALCFWLIFPIWRARAMIQGARKSIEFARETLFDSLADAGLPQEELLVNGVEHSK